VIEKNSKIPDAASRIDAAAQRRAKTNGKKTFQGVRIFVAGVAA